MVGEDTHKTPMQSGGNLPGPDVMLAISASWMDQISTSTQVLANPTRSWWDITADNPAVRMLTGGVKQFQESLSNDPTLRSIDQIWNANPLREVVPIRSCLERLPDDWLRTASGLAAERVQEDYEAFLRGS
jgi:polyhydroxyalkanoate synthase